MATVVLSRRLDAFTGGVEQLELPAETVRELIAALDERFPGLGAQLRHGTAVAIDGEIVEEALLETLGPDSEVHFLPSISGG